MHFIPGPTARLLFASAIFFLPAALSAQTTDEARLTMGVSAGWIGAKTLWDVPAQPILSTFDGPDLYHLHREIRADITISGSLAYFRSPHLGVVGEFTYLGLGTTDACTVVQDGGDASLVDACNALQGLQRPASVTTVQGGFIYRPLSRGFFQPYFKAMGGVAFTPSSPVAVASTYGIIGDTLVELTIYKDNGWHSIRPSWAFGAGIATAPSSGYQLRVEFRETWLAMSEITGPNATGQGFVPPTRSVIKGFPSIMVSFDVVLEKRHGRRY